MGEAFVRCAVDQKAVRLAPPPFEEMEIAPIPGAAAPGGGGETLTLTALPGASVPPEPLSV
jgi:hypothetical protein